jgi:hypothetical protein
VISAWLGGNRLGLVVMALVVGAGGGLGAALFREMGSGLPGWSPAMTSSVNRVTPRARICRGWGSGSCSWCPSWGLVYGPLICGLLFGFEIVL